MYDEMLYVRVAVVAPVIPVIVSRTVYDVPPLFDTSMTAASSVSTPLVVWNVNCNVAEEKPVRLACRAALGCVPVSGLSCKCRNPLYGVPTVTLPLLTPAPAVSLSTQAADQESVPSLFEKLAVVKLSLTDPAV